MQLIYITTSILFEKKKKKPWVVFKKYHFRSKLVFPVINLWLHLNLAPFLIFGAKFKKWFPQFLQLNYHCSPVEGYEHHRWRHRDRSSISHLAHHLPLAPVPPPPTTTTTPTTIEDNGSSNGFESAEEDEDEEEESEKDLSSTRSSSGFGLCSRCPPGFGVARRCTLVRDTVCHSCPQSYYAPSYSRKHACWPCSKCGKSAHHIWHFALHKRWEEVDFIFFNAHIWCRRSNSFVLLVNGGCREPTHFFGNFFFFPFEQQEILFFHCETHEYVNTGPRHFIHIKE